MEASIIPTMSIQHNRVSSYVQITSFESAIDAHWNSFETLEDAIKYLETEMVKKPGVEYGFVVVKNDLWKYIP
jgi:hypothetical protein